MSNGEVETLVMAAAAQEHQRRLLARAKRRRNRHLPAAPREDDGTRKPELVMTRPKCSPDELMAQKAAEFQALEAAVNKFSTNSAYVPQPLKDMMNDFEGVVYVKLKEFYRLFSAQGLVPLKHPGQ